MAKEVEAFYADATRKGHRLGGDIPEAYDPVEAKEIADKLNRHSCVDSFRSSRSVPSSVGQRLGAPSVSISSPSPALDLAAENLREAAAKAAERRAQNRQ